MIETRVELAVRASYSREMKFKRAVQAIIDRGEHPSVVRIRAELGRPVASGMINGRETRWRREYLISLR